MSELVEKIAYCIEHGKINKESPFPPDMKGQEGADELTRKALNTNVKPNDILGGCMSGMQRIGEKFSKNEVFVPELLIAAKAMNAVMEYLKPFFKSGEVKRKGTFIIGTVAGDLHDIGKKLVAMVVEGNGWEVIDLGVDVSTEKFLEEIEKHPDSSIGLSALLTTTMTNMEKTVQEIKEKHPSVQVLVGGAPLTQEYADKIGANGYSPNPQGAVEIINSRIK
jgi:methanogenic corrinoid protein MtbC1